MAEPNPCGTGAWLENRRDRGGDEERSSSVGADDDRHAPRADWMHNRDGTPTTAGPSGDVVEWYRRAVELLNSGDDAAAAVLLERALRAEPGSPALREAMGRARFGSRRYAESVDLFGSLVERDPTDHYARLRPRPCVEPARAPGTGIGTPRRRGCHAPAARRLRRRAAAGAGDRRRTARGSVVNACPSAGCR